MMSDDPVVTQLCIDRTAPSRATVIRPLSLDAVCTAWDFFIKEAFLGHSKVRPIMASSSKTFHNVTCYHVSKLKEKEKALHSR